MAAEGAPASEILTLIARASRSQFNRQVAKLLLKAGINPTISIGDAKSWNMAEGEGSKYAAAYNAKTNTVALFRPANAERHMLHELMHAATIAALEKKGLASVQMKALFAHVKKSGKLKGMYGMTNVQEFVAEVFSNPDFQSKLREVKAPAGSPLRSAWDWLVRILKDVLGLPANQQDALSRALENGIALMRENMRMARAQGDPLGSQDASVVEAEQQFRDTERAYGGREAYDRAKASGKTKLNYRQWVQVRTPRFKAWFGNWEAVRARADLQQMNPVQTRFDAAFNSDFVQAKAQSRAEFKKLSDVTERDGFGAVASDGRRIKFSGRGFKEVAQHSADRRVLSIAANLKSLFESAIPLYSTKPDSDMQQVSSFHYYGVKADFGERGEAYVLLEVIERTNGDFFYDADATSIEEIRAATSAPLANQTKTGAGDIGAARRGRLAQWWQGVNPDSVSKVVDPDTGEPMVVYHGTDQDVRAFDMKRGGTGTLARDAKKAAFFTSSERVAEDFSGYVYAAHGDDVVQVFGEGANVMPVFLRISNPTVWKMGGGAYSDAFMESALKGARKDRSDGVIFVSMRDGSISTIGPWKKSHVFAVFDPAQIKSATGNVGTFDPSDPDIRYNVADSFADLTTVQRDMLNKIGGTDVATSIKDWVREKSDRAMTKVRQGLVDRYAALKELDEKALGEDFVETNITESAWVLARMSSSASGALHALLNTGRVEFNKQQRLIGMKDGDTSGGLAKVFQKIGDAAEVARFFAWVAANRADKLMQEGREHLFTPDEIKAGQTLNTGKTKDERVRTLVYAQAFKEFQQYRDDVLAIAEATGVISAENRDMWRDEFYVPFYRVMAEDAAAKGPTASKGLSRQEAYKKLKGGRQNLNDLMENTLMNFHHLMTASLKNQAAAQTVENAVQLGIARPIAESARDPKNSTFVLEKGERKFYEIDDPLVFEALTALADPGLNNFAVRAMAAFKRLFTNMTTVTPQFIVANTIRDLMQASATSPASKNVFKNFGQGLKGYRDEVTRAKMLASGGAFSFGHLYGADVNEIQASLNRQMKGAKLITDPSMVPGLLRAGWNKWGDITDTAENISRTAVYQQNRDRGELRAAFEARDVMDFSQHGAWPAVRFLIRVVPFLNARLQGLDKLYRSGAKPALLTAMGKGTASDKQAAARFGAVTGALALASVVLYLLNADDDEYRKLEDWQKDSYWFFRIGDQAFFLPKPFEVGAIATLAERTAEQFVDDKATGKLFRQRLWAMLTQTFAFSPVPQMFQPALDVYSNIDAFTKREIETTGMERLSTGLRARDTTTVVARGISAASRTFGEESPVALSPVQADHLIKGYLGAVGAGAAGLVDTLWRAANGETTPDKRWDEFQPVKRFYRDLGVPTAHNRYSTLFYEGLREANRVYADVRELQSLGRMDDAEDLLDNRRGIYTMRTALTKQQQRLRDISNQMIAVRRSDNDGAWKRREIDRLNRLKSGITDVWGRRIEEVRAAGEG